jgi:hypothetical protein
MRLVVPTADLADATGNAGVAAAPSGTKSGSTDENELDVDGCLGTGNIKRWVVAGELHRDCYRRRGRHLHRANGAAAGPALNASNRN